MRRRRTACSSRAACSRPPRPFCSLGGGAPTARAASSTRLDAFEHRVVWFDLMGQSGAPRKTSRDTTGPALETAPAGDPADSGAMARALYVTGPATLGRHLLQ